MLLVAVSAIAFQSQPIQPQTRVVNLELIGLSLKSVDVQQGRRNKDEVPQKEHFKLHAYPSICSATPAKII